MRPSLWQNPPTAVARATRAADTVDTPTVTVATAIRRVLVCALAAWMALCCCEKRLLAEQFSAGHEAAAASAAPACCCCAERACGDADDATRPADGREDDPGDHENHPRHCADGCCQKAAPHVASFRPATDAVGAPLPDALLATEPRAASTTASSAAAPSARGPRSGESPGEPPPWLALLISARLRI
jgi:hypothetical protein